MKKVLFIALLMMLPLAWTVFADENNSSKPQVTISDVGVGKTTVAPSTPAGVSGGATVTREPAGITITGIASAVSVVDTQKVQGYATGTLRIRWGTGYRERQSMSPPGAPELPANFMFGSGLLVLGFGLLLYRKRLW